MENPFRDGGPADKAMPYLSLIVSANLLAVGVKMHQEAHPCSGHSVPDS
ncbi:hypothetical protein [Streptomyces sp. NPDC058755]